MTAIETLRTYRIGPFAIFDFAATFVGMYLISLLTKNYVSQRRLLWGALPLGVIAHEIVGVRTPLNRMVLGPETNLLTQAIVGLMLIKALEYPQAEPQDINLGYTRY
jgi:hypothetical protein